MKLKLTALLLTSLATAPAFAQEFGGFEMDPDSVVQSVEFTGRPGKISTAYIVRNEEGSEPSLLILERDVNDVRNVAVLDNNRLGLITDGLAGNNSSLETNKAGSLQILQGMENGRYRWHRILTVAHRNGKYVVAGFTYDGYDSLQEEKPLNCDYNLLTRKGEKHGRKVTIKTGALDLKTLTDTEKLYSCEKW